MGTWKYIALLAAFIVAMAGVALAESEIRTVVITDKYIEDVQMRRGRTAKRYVLSTDQGDFPILKFPVLGYANSVEDVYASVTPGMALTVRVAQWPPRLLGNKGKPHILEVY